MRAIRRFQRRSIRAGVAAVLVMMLPAAAGAQYFGTNKIQYRSLDFRVLKTEHFDIYFHEVGPEPVEIAARLAEQWHERLSHALGHELRGRQPLVLYGSHVDFEQTPIVPELVEPGTGGLTEPWRRRIVMPFGGSLAETSHVIGHELVHAFQFDVTRDRRGSLPTWFVEGMAEFFTLGAVDTHTSMWLRDAMVARALPSVADLERASYFPYRWGHAFWAYVDERWGDRVTAQLFAAAARGDVATALSTVLGVTEEEFTTAWHAAIRDAYVPHVETSAPLGRLLIGGRALSGTTNLGPAMSPDGRWLAFLSERAFFTIDLFVADAISGEVVGKLTDTAADPHYSNLQFIDSAGAWDRSSRRLAVGTVTSGRAALSVFGWPSGARELEVVVEDVAEIYNPTWSPDGGSIAFSGTTNGVTDLFVYDLLRSRLRRLTHDSFADLQPAWEPNGRRLAFVTDRFTTDIGALELGDWRLALIDVDTGAIRPVRAFTTGKHISPQWSPDGDSLYFISDYDGTSNLHRVELQDDTLTQLTTAATGLSGLTAASPALSVAAGAGVAAVSVFEYGRFAIYTLMPAGADPRQRQGTATTPQLPTIDTTAATPSFDHLRPPPSPEPSPASRYKPRFSLEGISQVTFGVGTDRLGATVGTGLGLVFTDILNTHWVVGALQLNHRPERGVGVDDIAMHVAYFNRARRWNWGFIGSHVPTLALVRQTERAGTAVASYAFSRARRVEFHATTGQLTFARGSQPRIDQDGWTAPSSLTFAGAGAAIVSDTTRVGGASVAIGERYRFEVGPTVGTTRYLNVLADYRRYFMPVRFYTIAARVLHFGRYGAGADDPRVPPLYLGSPTLVRGYAAGSQMMSDCSTAASAECRRVDRMIGSRLAVGNVELRFPLLTPFGVSPQVYGPVPVELALFVDAGLVGHPPRTPWSSAASPGSAWSAGVTLRTSVLGLGLGQFDIVRPSHGPRPGWVFQFNLAPAF